MLIHFISIKRLLLLYNVILLFVGTGDTAIGFGRFEVFLRGTLPAHELREERTVMADVDRKTGPGNREKRSNIIKS